MRGTGNRQRRITSSAFTVGLAAIALLGASCAGEEDTGGEGEATEVEVGEDGELTIVMNEYSFTPDTITVTAGQEVQLTILNEGAAEHELMIGSPVGTGPEWEHDLFAEMAPEVVSGEEYTLEGFEGMHEEGEEEGGEEGHGAEVEVEAGGEVTLRLHVPEDAAGEWEMGCFLPRHYEEGMKGTLTVA